MENPDTTTGGEPRSTSSKWLRIALFLSLAVNFAVVGLAIGAAMHDRPDGPRRGPPDPNFGVFDQALSRADRTALRRQFIAEAGPILKERADLRSEVGEVLTVLRAEPLDVERLTQAMSGLAMHGRDRLALGQKLLTERLVSMTPQERARFADRLEDILARRSRDPDAGTAGEQQD